MKDNEKKKVFSSHIFIFPFTWDILGNKKDLNSSFNERVDLEKFDELIDKSKWERKDVAEHIRKGDEKDSKITKDKKININVYNQKSYFYENVRYALFDNLNEGDDLKIVRNYRYKFEKGQYSIDVRKYNESGENTHNDKYNLNITDIGLKIFETGVGLLMYYLENIDYSKLEDILIINDYGRRIYPQFLSLDEAKGSLLPEYTSIDIDGNEFIENFESYEEKDNKKVISDIIMKTLGESTFIDNRISIKKNNILIKPIIDDRMYTICWYANNRFLKTCEEDLYNENWYKYIFVDGGSRTVFDDFMAKDLIEKSTYTRWLRRKFDNKERTDVEELYGTLFGITRYSFMVLGDEGWFNDNKIRNHCKNIYSNLVALLLVERASILRFSNEISKLSQLKTDDTKENKKLCKDISELYRHYIKFVNQLYFREVTAQEQGIELYRIGVDITNIDNEVKALDEEIQELHQYAELISDNIKNKTLDTLSILGGALAVPSFMAGYFGMNIFGESSFDSLKAFVTVQNIGIFFSMLAMAIIIIAIIKRKR